MSADLPAVSAVGSREGRTHEPDRSRARHGLSLNRVGFGLVYLFAPGRGGQGWIGRVAWDPATQVFVRGHGARDVALGAGAIAALLRRERGIACGWMSAQAIADGADVYATLVSRRAASVERVSIRARHDERLDDRRAHSGRASRRDGSRRRGRGRAAPLA